MSIWTELEMRSDDYGYDGEGKRFMYEEPDLRELIDKYKILREYLLMAHLWKVQNWVVSKTWPEPRLGMTIPGQVVILDNAKFYHGWRIATYSWLVC